MEASRGQVIRRRGAAPLLAASVGLVLALMLSGCGETNPLNPDPLPTPTPAPAKANVTLALDAIRLDDSGSLPGYGFSLVSNLHLAETAGVAATIDYIRLDVYLPNDTLLERTQIGSAQIPGGTALAARGVRDLTGLALGFNSDIARGRYAIVSVSTTDARGNVQVVATGRLIFA
jgi:hypothetical protein